MSKQRKRTDARAASRERAESLKRDATLYDVRHAETLAGLNGRVATIAEGTGSVAGGFRTGKRKRGSSLLNVNAKLRGKNVAAKVLPVDVLTDSGTMIANVRTLNVAPNVRVTFADESSQPGRSITPAVQDSADSTDAKLDALIALLDAKIADCIARENASRAAAYAARPRTILEDVRRLQTFAGLSREDAIARAIAQRMPKRKLGAYLP